MRSEIRQLPSEHCVQFPTNLLPMLTSQFTTLPIDTAKVRLQLQGGTGSALKYKGMLGTMATVAREEGLSALWSGLG